jgi:hypothetical protein
MKIDRVILLFVLMFSFSNISLAAIDQRKVVQCDSTKEYMTTLSFLRESKSFQIQEKNARQLAFEVSTGCSGSAQRFINIVSLLTKASIDSVNSIRVAKEIALKDDKVNQTFIKIFRRGYRSRDFDLSANDALMLARNLAIDYEGNIDTTLKNFDIFASFCLSYEGLDLPKLKCAKMIKRLIKVGEKFEQPIAKHYIELYDFLVSKDGSNLPLYKALEYAEASIKFGPKAVNNFKEGYKFAIHKKGLNMGQDKAIEFAVSMAKNTLKVQANH